MLSWALTSLQWRHNGRDGVSNHQSHDCLLNRLVRHRSKKISKLRVTGIGAGNSPVTSEFPAQRASNASFITYLQIQSIDTSLPMFSSTLPLKIKFQHSIKIVLSLFNVLFLNVALSLSAVLTSSRDRLSSTPPGNHNWLFLLSFSSNPD